MRADRTIIPEAGDLITPEWSDIMEFNFLEAAMRAAKPNAFEIHPWITPLYQGIHGSNYGGKFAGKHPEFWCRLANGEVLWHPSLAYPEVRQHHLDMIEELIENYGVKGIHLDFIRMLRSVFDLRDKSGASILGYDPPLVEAFRREFGDPAHLGNANEKWIRFRADRTYTQFLRDLRDRFGRRLEISVLVLESNNLGGCLLDWQTWAKEKLVDVLCIIPSVPFHVYPYFDAVHIFKKHVGDDVKVLEFVSCDAGMKGAFPIVSEPLIPPKPSFAMLNVEFALQRGADGVMMWEADAFDNTDYWDVAAAIARKVREYGAKC